MKLLRLISVLIYLFMGSSAFAQASANFTASVTVIQPIGITTTSNMDFANLDARTGGEVVLTPGNERRVAGGIKLAEGGSVSAATFEVTGESGLTYTLTLPEEQFVLTNGKESIVIKNFTSNSGTGLLAGGTQTINVGATLDVKPNPTPGYYTSQYPMNVTVNYN